jgi:hypothetical protein
MSPVTARPARPAKRHHKTLKATSFAVASAGLVTDDDRADGALTSDVMSPMAPQ